ncbi:hypothetical protein GN956_G19229 [Arapaima gigas]
MIHQTTQSPDGPAPNASVTELGFQVTSHPPDARRRQCLCYVTGRRAEEAEIFLRTKSCQRWGKWGQF